MVMTKENKGSFYLLNNILISQNSYSEEDKISWKKFVEKHMHDILTWEQLITRVNVYMNVLVNS